MANYYSQLCYNVSIQDSILKKALYALHTKSYYQEYIKGGRVLYCTCIQNKFKLFVHMVYDFEMIFMCGGHNHNNTCMHSLV